FPSTRRGNPQMTGHLRKRELKQRVREVRQETFGDIAPDEEAMRAARLRELCPCEHQWSIPLWDLIFEACADPSPLGRMEAVHVLQDSRELGILPPRGLKYLYAARRDASPQVRRYAEDLIRQASLEPRRKAMRHREGDTEPELEE